jgi:predicted N-acyltransferase
MDFDVQIAHSVAEVGQEAWDRLGHDRPFSSYGWYRFGETVLSDNVPIYIILSRDGRPVARGTFWLRGREPLPIESVFVRRFTERLLTLWPLLICKAPLTSLSGLILPEPPLREAAIETISRIALEQAQHHRASFLVFDYLTGREAELAGWPCDFAPAQISDPGTRMDILWSDFDGYLAHLSKSARKDYRRHRNRAADLGVEIASHPITESLEEDVIDQSVVLIRNVDKYHNSASHPYGRAMLEYAHMADATWLTATVKDDIVGCGLMLGDRDVHFLALLGLDYEARYAYFQMVYAAIRSAIENHVKVLRGGSGTYELKLRLGFQLEDNNYVTFAGIGSVFQRFGRWAAKMV